MSDNANEAGFAALDAMIAKVRTLPGAMLEGAADDVADAVRGEVERTIAAGTDPDGSPWASLKQRSGKPLENAARAVHVQAVGRTIYVRLVGIEARHHRGTVRGRVRRQVIPAGKWIPAPMLRVVLDALGRRFQEHMQNG